MSEWDIPTHFIPKPDRVRGAGEVESEENTAGAGAKTQGGAENQPADTVAHSSGPFVFGGLDRGHADAVGAEGTDHGVDRPEADRTQAGACEVSLKRFSKLTKELSNAKRSFTLTMGRLFSNPQNIHLVSDAELVELRGTLTEMYEQLRQVYRETRNATDDLAMLAKVDSGFASYQQDYENMHETLLKERRARMARAQERQDQQVVTPARSFVDDHRTEDGGVAGDDELSLAGTPFQTVNQSPSLSSLSSQERETNPRQRVEFRQTDESSQSMREGVRTRQNGDNVQSVPVTQESDEELTHSQRRGRPKKGRSKRPKARNFPSTGGHQGAQSTPHPSNVQAPTATSLVPVDGLEVIRLVNAGHAAGWSSERIKQATNQYYQTGVFPAALQSAGQRKAQFGTEAQIGSQRAVNFNVSHAPSFVAGANATPLGQNIATPVPTQHVPSAVSGFPQNPTVPMPQQKQLSTILPSTFSNPPPQSQATLPWPPPLTQPPPVQSFGYSGLYTNPTLPGMVPSSMNPQWFSAPVQATSIEGPKTGPETNRQAGGMFGNHSFSENPPQRQTSWTEQINWGYDPRSYLEKPLMRINHVSFDGTTRSCSFEEFRATFAVVCGSRNMPEAQKLVCLKQLLAGDPLKIFNNVVGFDFLPGSLERVLRTLENHFGGPQRIVNSYINRLTQHSPIRKFDCSSLLDLLTIIEEIYNRYEMQSPGFLEKDEVLVTHLRRIIPVEERQAYYSKLAEHRRRDTFLTLRDYLRSRYESFRLAAIADAGMPLKQSTHHAEEDWEQEKARFYQDDPSGTEALFAGSEVKMTAKAQEGAHALTQSQGSSNAQHSSYNPLCSFCSKNHYIWKCPDFAVLDVKLRFEHVKEKKLCFHCLLGGHRARGCKFRPDLQCGLEGCRRKHHRLVHNHAETGLCTIEIFMLQNETEEDDPEGQIEKSLLSMSLASEGRGVVLPLEEEYISIRTVTLEIRCGEKRKRVLAALDSCSNNTNIDADLAAEMGLPVLRADIPREMQFLERKAHLTSNFVKFIVSPLGSDARYEMSGFTIKNLMAGSPIVDWSEATEKYPHLKEAGIPTQRSSDRVQILIGTEFAELMTPHRVLRGLPGSGAPIAELTDLGWAFSGRTGKRSTRQVSCQVDCSFFWHTFMAVGKFDLQKEPCESFGTCSASLLESLPQENFSILDTDLEQSRTDQSCFEMSVARDTSDSSGFQTLASDFDLIDFETEIVTSSPVSKTTGITQPGEVENLKDYLGMLQRPDCLEQVSLCQTEWEQDLNDLMQRHWELEAVGLLDKAPRCSRVKDPSPRQWTSAEVESDNKLKVVYLEEKGQFQMSIPWKAVRPEFKNNRFAVKKRQEATLRKLGSRIEDVRKIFAAYLEKGYIRQIDYAESQEVDCRYLPFFCVIDESKDTTPVRIVWDCRAVYDGKSLNSEIELTPNRLQDLFTVLLRLRKFQFTIASDVSEMFLKILMDPKDRRYHRFVFDGADFEWNVILFGNLSSPNGSQKVLAKTCELFGQEYPEAVQTIMESCYMDDASDSRPSEEQALALAQQLVKLLAHCQMPIHKFYTNSMLVIQNIDPKLLAKQISLQEKDVVIESGKILGMKYSVEDGDVLMFAGKFKSVHDWTNKAQETHVEEGQWTKRLVSRAAASIYDPHGLISPFTVRAKVILQEIWKRKDLGWDDCLPPELCKVWEAWLEQVFEVPDIQIPRWSGFEPKCQAQIHTFCDASEEGMCCAVYLRVRKGSSIGVTLLAAKARVSPLKADSIARLELCACVLGTRLCAAVKEVFPVGVEDTFFWTDSEVCLHWINTPSKSFKAYVAHRVGEIQNYTEPRQWLHVPGSENPADIGTRPVTARELKNRWLWWGGPNFLRQPMTNWPRSKVVGHIETKEVKNTIFLNVAPLKETKFVDTLAKIHPRNFSVGKIYNGLKACVQIWAYVIRAVRVFRGGMRVNQAKLHPGEIEASRRHLIRQAQLSAFREEIGLLSRDSVAGEKSLAQFPEARRSRILKFNPFLDEFGVLRSRSRLEKGNIYSYDKTYPIILDRRSDLTRLIVEDAHHNFQHPVGSNAMKAALSARLIIIGLGTLCHQIKFRCSTCRSDRAQVASQLQAPLPERRLGRKLRPFTDVGMDFAGPFEVKVGRGKPRKKLYVLVLTCMSIRAVHLEPTGGTDTTHVVNAISRFVDVRGIPESITSDNQTSFQKADKDLTEWIKAIDLERLKEETGPGFRPNSPGIQWHFNPPLAPHFGGVFEIIVKAMKRALKATVGCASLAEEEFRTVISKVSWMLNNRPIQPVGDSSDLEALTPNHFLNGASEDVAFPPDLPAKGISLQDRLKYQVEIQKHFWQRFQAEIVPLLAPRKKWMETFDNLKEDDVVIEVDENSPRGEWRKMRVTRVIPSDDGLVRKVEVTNGCGKFYVRPISRLIPIVF